ncbi:sensor histidine kinase [Haloarcula montana]|uniref:sensor histidine kinase n=1 Tax=Haloarcula montana TaxID=3111776 RepID=UPI002D781515|nr:ATP-binding protein [Haloarcula sp. GH36]
MKTPTVSKGTLGTGYLVAIGVTLTLALACHAASVLDAGPSGLLVVATGLVPALSLAAANYWLPRSGLEGDQIWTVAEWGGLGIALLTLVTLGTLVVGVPSTSLVSALLASSIAMGGFVGILVGALLELRRARRRLRQSNAVLNRVLRHDMRNDFNVVLGHLSVLEAETTGDAADRVDRMSTTVDRMISTTEKARQIDAAVAADRTAQTPTDIVPVIEDRLAALEQSRPDVTVEVTLPESAVVYVDWQFETVVDNLLENAVVHAEGDPWVGITAERVGNRLRVHVQDNCPPIEDRELTAFTATDETPLNHASGVGLWLVTWVIESYEGSVWVDRVADGNVVTLELRATTTLRRLARRVRNRLWDQFQDIYVPARRRGQ